MKRDIFSIIPTGMQKDISVNQFPNNMAFNIKNMRIVSTGDSNTTLCLVNEKGNSKDTNISTQIKGIVIGAQIIKDVIILFTTDNTTSYIYKAILKNDNLNAELLVSGTDFKFNTDNPIESIGIYENENIQKVYWVDGINQPRVINICEDNTGKKSIDFDFKKSMNSLSTGSKITMGINIQFGANGSFNAGVVQYAISYYNKHTQESGIVYVSPLYYTSDNGRGLNPDGTQKSSEVFELTIQGIDTSWEYLRVYRLFRTSLEASPEVSILGDFKNKESSYTTTSKVESHSIFSIDAIKYGDGEWYNTTTDLLSNLNASGIHKYNGTASTNYTPYIIINDPDTAVNPKEMYIKSGGKQIYYPAGQAIKILCSNDQGKVVDLDTYNPTLIGNMINAAHSSGGVWTDENFYYTYSIINGGIKIVDNGTTGELTDISQLRFAGGTYLKAGTISHKDNVLFLGNLDFESDEVTSLKSEIKDNIKKNSTVEYVLSKVNGEDSIDSLNTQWSYKSNLDKGSDTITFFQKGETYRIGVQLLNKFGEWSEAIWLGDYTNPYRVKPNIYNDGISKRPVVSIDLNTTGLKGYIAARAVCVYPSIYDRSVLCQGLICPTLYNIKDRVNNAPYVQSSWFTRPRPANIAPMVGTENPSAGEKTKQYLYWNSNTMHRGAPLAWNMVSFLGGSFNEGFKDWVKYLPSSKYANGEIFGVTGGPDISNGGNNGTSDDENDFKATYGIDERIVTMHSPELDQAFTDDLYNISLDGVKFRVVGFAPVKTTFSDININFTNPFKPGLSNTYNNYIEYSSTTKNLSGYSLINFPFFIDAIASGTNETSPTKGWSASFPIYPWHRNGSLNNQGKTDSSDNRKSLLKDKVMSNLRICLPSEYLDSTSDEAYYNIPISNVELFSSDVVSNKTLDLWEEKLIYRGNIDSIITFDGDGKFDERAISVQNALNTDNPPTNEIQSPYNNNQYTNLTEYLSESDLNNRNIFSSDPVPIQYKSTGHAVFGFKEISGGTYNGYYELLPLIVPLGLYTDGKTNTETFKYTGTDDKLLWLSKTKRNSFKGLYQKAIKINDDTPLSLSDSNPESDHNNKFGYYYVIGELYRDNIVNKFGGTTEQALLNNTWNICSDVVYFNQGSNVTIIANQGDTFFSRYDHIKTYPFSQDNLNRVVDIVSFCCETRLNLDGRYDKNRGNKSNLTVTPANFNLYNKVYSQRNNLFNPVYVNSDDVNTSKFPNQVLWSISKTLGESIDSWTNINALSILDLDGDKGGLNAIRRFNNELYAFQDKGISQIIFNPRVQIASSDGIPIELSNSKRVEGKVYLTDKYGCINKWSITETPNGLYFVDDNNRSIMHFNGKSFNDLTASKNMYSWIVKNINKGVWNHNNKSAVRTLYDYYNKDIYFTTKDESLAYNEKLGNFTSFYSYEDLDFMLCFKDLTYQIKNNEFWKLHKGDEYTNIFGIPRDYSITLIANPNFILDKVFDSVEFRTNGTESFEFSSFNELKSNNPFNKLIVENEYQKSETTKLLKKKFRTWRWSIGRDNRDRIRNMWSKITLEGNRNDELRVYDIAVNYYY